MRTRLQASLRPSFCKHTHTHTKKNRQNGEEKKRGKKSRAGKAAQCSHGAARNYSPVGISTARYTRDRVSVFLGVPPPDSRFFFVGPAARITVIREIRSQPRKRTAVLIRRNSRRRAIIAGISDGGRGIQSASAILALHFVFLDPRCHFVPPCDHRTGLEHGPEGFCVEATAGVVAEYFGRKT